MVIARRSMFFILLLFIQNQRYVVESKVDKVGYSGTLQAPCLNCTKTMSLDEEQHGKQDAINSSTRRQSSFTLHDETNTTNNVHQATTFTAFVHTIQSPLPPPPPPTIKSRRDTRNKENLIAALRKQLTLKDNKKDEQLMADARLEQNYSAPYYNKMPTDNINVEQDFNKNNNKLRQLHNLHYPMREQGYIMPAEVECTFEESCKWQWRNDIHDGFINTTSADYGPTDTGPMYDADNRTSGHFLLLRITASTKELHVTSPLFRDSPTQCRLEVALYQGGMYQGVFKAVVDTFNHTQWVIGELTGQDANRWKVHKISVGRIKQVFRIILEVVPGDHEAYIAIDNIKLIDCFSDYTRPVCTPHQFRCMHSDICINTTKICDITLDCQYGDDEIQNCDKMPVGARCNFEDDWCGWHNSIDGMMQWSRHNGSTPTNKTGPNFDNTYKNSTGKYLYVNMAESMPKGAGFASSATINSVIFNPPPRVHGNSSSRFYNSCIIRFYYHQYGYHKSGIALLVIEMKPRENITTDIWWSHEDHGDAWLRRTIILPNITHRYYLQFEARKGISSRSDVAIDDFSLSPECFGLNIPSSELNGYNYWDATQIMLPAHKNEPHTDFINATYFEFTTCGARGTKGPTQENCTRAYNNTKTRVEVLDKPRLAGVQKWTPLESGIYTLILFGAGGGKGSSGMGSSRGAMVRTVLELTTADKLYVLVGQEGISACLKSLGHTSNSSCESLKDSSKNLTGIRGVLNMKLKDGGGGGGGATFVFKVNGEKLIPVAIAAGGGGLGLGHFVDNGLQHGQAINMSRPPVTGNMYGPDSAGAGGGWNMFKGLVAPGHDTLMGGALLDGGRGGLACYSSTDGNGNGGFGGGGGGCNAGGGGGGYAGGNAWSKNTTNGEGGYSFLDLSKTIPKYSVARSGQHAGPGMVMLIPAKAGCGCDYRCLPLDVRRSEVVCICPKEFTLDQDGKTCIFAEAKPSTDPKALITILIIIIIILIIAFGALCIILYNRYQHRANGVWRRKMLSGPELQLNRLRVASDSMMTEYNPNYEFGGVVYTLKDLKDIPRDQLRLVKALGQGAFGEVYQGFYRQRSGDAVEMPVAVKTLPEMSTNQAEMDFLMEALIMSKFNHPNIVHFIGVCFDKHPRFIVLELLAGGDLKNFLRESRPKPGRGSSLSMKDLVLISIDVAKGCKYMEDNRFIHRDIAARNCLLTTKGPGRVVKIADFGMSRDIYRSDYYRKGGTAMLPIKWMPPEAFLDGIFTSKTDVWSFGVLLWETMSMGYMPYTGCANRDVMQLVTSGGRLEPPANCPGPLYAIMTQCWHPNPEQRPNFSLILERLGYCAQDPEVMNALLPVFNRPPSNERDTTVMRPEHSDQSYLKVPHAQDYLIPTTNHPTDMQNSVSTSSVDKLITNESDNWETSFVMPHSKSTQPLLQDNEQHTDDTNNSTDKLINMDSPQSGASEHPIPVPAPVPVPPVQPVVANNTNSNVTTTTTTTTNHNNNTKNDNIKSGISLDACKLAKQNMAAIGNNIGQKKPYVNVNTCTDTTVTGNGVVVQQNGPFSIQTQPAVLYMNNTANRHNDSEISC